MEGGYVLEGGGWVRVVKEWRVGAVEGGCGGGWVCAVQVWKGRWV